MVKILSNFVVSTMNQARVVIWSATGNNCRKNLIMISVRPEEEFDPSSAKIRIQALVFVLIVDGLSFKVPTT